MKVKEEKDQVQIIIDAGQKLHVALLAYRTAILESAIVNYKDERGEIIRIECVKAANWPKAAMDSANSLRKKIESASDPRAYDLGAEDDDKNYLATQEKFSAWLGRNPCVMSPAESALSIDDKFRLIEIRQPID